MKIISLVSIEFFGKKVVVEWAGWSKSFEFSRSKSLSKRKNPIETDLVGLFDNRGYQERRGEESVENFRIFIKIANEIWSSQRKSSRSFLSSCSTKKTWFDIPHVHVFQIFTIQESI